MTSSGLAVLALAIAMPRPRQATRACTRDTKRLGSGNTSVLVAPRPIVPPSAPNTAEIGVAGGFPWYETTDISYTAAPRRRALRSVSRGGGGVSVHRGGAIRVHGRMHRSAIGPRRHVALSARSYHFPGTLRVCAGPAVRIGPRCFTCDVRAFVVQLGIHDALSCGTRSCKAGAFRMRAVLGLWAFLP